MSILAAIIVMYGIYTTFMGTIFISFPYCRLSLCYQAIRHNAEEIYGYGIRKLIIGMVLVGAGTMLALSPYTGQSGSIEFLAYLGVSSLIFGFLLLSNILTSRKTKLKTSSVRQHAVLLYQPWVSYMGTENQPGKDLKRYGSLELTHEEILFRHAMETHNITIPIQEIINLGVGLWHKKRTKVCPILKISFAKDEKEYTVGFAMGKTKGWIEEILNSAKGFGHAIEVSSNEILPSQIQFLRIKIYGFILISLSLILTIVIAVARLLGWNIDMP